MSVSQACKSFQVTLIMEEGIPNTFEVQFGLGLAPSKLSDLD